MDQTVEDRVRQRRIADQVVPLLDRDLAGDQSRAPTVAILEDLQEVAPSVLVRRHQAPPLAYPRTATAGHSGTGIVVTGYTN